MEKDLNFYENNGISLEDVRLHDSTKDYVLGVALNKYLKKRNVWWFAETYLEPCEFEYALSKATHWAYIYHDKDVSADGRLKEPHYHILLHYDNSRTGFAVLRDFVGRQNTFVKDVYKNSSPVICYEYLTHDNDVDKYHYSKANIVSHNPVYWEHFLPSVRDRTQTDFLEDLLQTDTDLDLREMAKKYGRDFIKNYRTYIEFRNEVVPYDKQTHIKY